MASRSSSAPRRTLSFRVNDQDFSPVKVVVFSILYHDFRLINDEMVVEIVDKLMI